MPLENFKENIQQKSDIIIGKIKCFSEIPSENIPGDNAELNEKNEEIGKGFMKSLKFRKFKEITSGI